MPKKQLTDTEMTKISARARIITTVMIGIVTLLVAMIGFIRGSLSLQKRTSAPIPTSESQRWYVIFELKFPANTWAEGVHSFLFDADCPVDIQSKSENGPTNPFSVDSTAKIQNSTVFIRRRGLYLTEIDGDAFGHLIHPSQETAAVYSLFVSSPEDAKRLQAECKVIIKIDNRPFVNLTAIRIDKTQ